MKKSVKLSGVLALAGLTAMIVAPNTTFATGIGYETCSTYSCVSTVRQKANTFHLTKGVLKLTNDFISKVEAKANSKYNGTNSVEGKKYQYRIYGVTSQKFLEVSLLLRNNADFKKNIKNSDKLAKVCYDLAEIFKIKSEMANGSYNGGHYYFDKYFGNGVNAQNVWGDLLNASKALKEKLDNPSTVKDGKYDDAKKFYDGNIDKVGDGTANGAKVKEDEAKALTNDFNKHKDALTSNDALDALRKAADNLKDKLGHKNVIKDRKYDEGKKFYDDNADKVKDNKLGTDDAKKLADEFKKYADALNFADWLDDLRAAAKELKDGLDNPKVKQDSAYDNGKRFYNDNIKKTDDTGLSKPAAEELAKEFRAMKNKLSFNSDDGDANLSTAGDTVVAGDALRDMFKWMKTANKDKVTVNSAFQKFFEGKKASGMYFDTDYTLGIGEGSNTVVPNRATKFDLSKLLNNNSLSFVTIGYRVENFDIVNSKYVKLYNNKIIGLKEGGSDRDTDALSLMNEYNKGWLEANDGYFGIAPFANKNTANEFIRQQKMDGAVAVQLGNSGKYMVVFKPAN